MFPPPSVRYAATYIRSQTPFEIGGKYASFRALEQRLSRQALAEPVRQWLTAPAGGAGGSNGQVKIGSTVLLAPRTRTSSCTAAAEPDRRCSPGAYSSGLTKTVLCSSSIHTGSVRNVSEATRHAVEVEYGMVARASGSTLEIDHIVSLELGGSNDPANLFPERANAHPGYHAKDKLESATHAWVCEGKIALRTAQRKIAANWETFYKLMFGRAPGG